MDVEYCRNLNHQLKLLNEDIENIETQMVDCDLVFLQENGKGAAQVACAVIFLTVCIGIPLRYFQFVSFTTLALLILFMLSCGLLAVFESVRTRQSLASRLAMYSEQFSRLVLQKFMIEQKLLEQGYFQMVISGEGKFDWYYENVTHKC